MKRCVVSQSMYFPWVGLLEQIQLADVFVHYDDVQFARGFLNRVQIKTLHGPKWLSVPIRGRHRGQLIGDLQVDDSRDWKSQHRTLLRQVYLKAPYCEEMLELVDQVFSISSSRLCDISRASIITLANYFGVESLYEDSLQLGVGGRSSQRLHDIVLRLNGTVYITGHGAWNYLDHNLFEESGIEVHYMNYECNAYPQLYGDFTPYVSSLDLVANCGREGRQFISSQAVHWSEFANGMRVENESY